MKKKFNKYIKVPLIFFLISLAFIVPSILIAVSSFKNQNSYYLKAIILFIPGLIFFLLAIHWCISDYKERKK